jgi:hypothetical protein
MVQSFLRNNESCVFEKVYFISFAKVARANGSWILQIRVEFTSPSFRHNCFFVYSARVSSNYISVASSFAQFRIAFQSLVS